MLLKKSLPIPVKVSKKVEWQCNYPVQSNPMQPTNGHIEQNVRRFFLHMNEFILGMDFKCPFISKNRLFYISEMDNNLYKTIQKLQTKQLRKKVSE